MRPLLVTSILMLAALAWAQCDHPFFPVREGWVWSYRLSVDNSTYTVSFTNVSARGFTQRQTLKDIVIESRWSCESSGLIQPEYIQPLNNRGVQMNLKTRKADGVTIPQVMQVGTTWSYSYEVSGEMKQQGMTMQIEQSISTTNKVLGQESVTVPAGHFTALKVESTTTIRGSMKMGEHSIPLSTTLKTYAWYAQGWGWLRASLKAAPPNS